MTAKEWMQASYEAGRASRDAEVEVLRADAERLDYMIDNRAYVVSDHTACDGFWLHYARPDGTTWVQGSEHATPRKAIDAAMSAQEG